MVRKTKQTVKFLGSAALCALLGLPAIAEEKKNAGTRLLESAEAATEAAFGNEVNVDYYGSFRIGADYVDAGVEQDGLNGRDFLSRLGVKAAFPVSEDLSFTGQFEYGTRSDVVDFFQGGGLGLRIATVGVKSKQYGSLTFGSQTTVFHSFVRGSYFSDGLDTVRLGTIREDDFLRYEYKKNGFRLGLGTQIEGQDGDDFDQFQVGLEYDFGAVKLQSSYVRDNEGVSEGDQYGVRGWWTINKTFTLSAYHHEQDSGFDFPSGVGSTGAVRLRAANGGLGDINIIPTCVGEQRTASGLYGRVNLNKKHTVHARYAVDSCDISGDVDSFKVEYRYKPRKDVSLWLAFEHLNNDEGRIAVGLDEDNYYYVQTGLRLDF